MKKIFTVLLLGLSTIGLVGCQSATKYWGGGTTTLELEPNQKLEDITWKKIACGI